MGFQDEIDDEDFLHHSSRVQPAIQVSDSSDEELETLKPVPIRLVTRPTFEASRPATDVHDDLDDWLNEPDEQPNQTQHVSPKEVDPVHGVRIATDQMCLEDKNGSAEESDADEIETKVTKKTKDKKSKRKSKKSKRERYSPDGEDGDFQPSRPVGDYEEI